MQQAKPPESGMKWGAFTQQIMMSALTKTPGWAYSVTGMVILLGFLASMLGIGSAIPRIVEAQLRIMDAQASVMIAGAEDSRAVVIRMDALDRSVSARLRDTEQMLKLQGEAVATLLGRQFNERLDNIGVQMQEMRGQLDRLTATLTTQDSRIRSAESRLDTIELWMERHEQRWPTTQRRN